MTRFGPRAVLATSAAYAVLYGVAELSAVTWPHVFGWTWTTSPAADVGLGAAVAAVVCAVSWSFSIMTHHGRLLARDLAMVLRGIPAWGIPLVAASAGVAEEAVFRGALWTVLETSAGPAAAFLLTSVTFGAAHGLFSRRLVAWSVFALLSGLLLGLLRILTGGLLAPVVAHVLVDAVNMPVILKAGLDEGTATSGSPPGAPP